MKTKNEICVPIRNEKELQQAREILERNGEQITKDGTFRFSKGKQNYLVKGVFYTWWVSYEPLFTEISLSELEAVLRGESEIKELFKKPFRRCEKINDTILDADGRRVFKLNKVQYGHKLINKIVESINND